MHTCYVAWSIYVYSMFLEVAVSINWISGTGTAQSLAMLSSFADSSEQASGPPASASADAGHKGHLLEATGHSGPAKHQEHRESAAHLTSADKAALCKVVAVGNAPSHSIKLVAKLARTCGKVHNIQTTVPAHVMAFAKLQQDGCSSDDVMLVHYATGKEAFEAVWKLHGAQLEGSKKRKNRLWARQVNGEGAHVRVLSADGAHGRGIKW
jgi:hypothetical protein